MPQVFAEPGRLIWLVVALLAAVGVAGGSNRRRREWRSLGMAGEPPTVGAWPWWFAAVALILTLAAPRWGRIAGSELPPGHDVVLLVDVSRSMAAEDALPDRLGLARTAARSLVDQLRQGPGDRSAVVAFAGRAVARCPLTENLDAVADSLDALRPGMIEPGGTDLGAGLAAALGAFDTQEHAEGRSIVIFSDGEDHADSWPALLGRLVEDEVVVHVVAIGDAEHDHPVPPGTRPPAPSSATPPAMTRRTDAALTQLAQATGGAVVPLGVAAGDLGDLYRDRIEPTERSRRSADPRFAERAERYSVCLSVALVAGLLGTWPPPRRVGRYARVGGRTAGRWFRLLLVGLVALVLTLISLAAGPTAASPSSRAAAAVAQGVRASREGRFADALRAFDAATTAQPANPVGPFDAASALFALGRYPEAVVRYGQARERADRRLVIKVDYALGNSLALLGDLPGAIRHYDACLGATAPGDDLDAVRRDAAINRAFVLTRMTPPQSDPRDGPGDGTGPGDQNGGSDKQRSSRSDRQPGSPRPDPNSRTNGNDTGSAGIRGQGGAGGGDAAPPEADSPSGRLDAALRRIKAAKDQQPSDPPPPPPPGPRSTGKDW